jgi:hypothetical protein
MRPRRSLVASSAEADVASRLDPAEEARPLEPLDLSRVAVVGDAAGALADDPELVVWELEGASKSSKFASVSSGMPLVLSNRAVWKTCCWTAKPKSRPMPAALRMASSVPTIVSCPELLRSTWVTIGSTGSPRSGASIPAWGVARLHKRPGVVARAAPQPHRRLRVTPNQLVISLTRDAVAGLSIGFRGVRVTGDHIQTYIWSWWLSAGWAAPFGFRPDFAEDIMPLGHEIAEWVNDPLIDNDTPTWAYSVPPLVTNGCGEGLEVGDPLEMSEFTTMLGGTTYHLPDEGFLSWFARQVPSIGYSGRYSFTGTFTTYSTPC